MKYQVWRGYNKPIEVIAQFKYKEDANLLMETLVYCRANSVASDETMLAPKVRASHGACVLEIKDDGTTRVINGSWKEAKSEPVAKPTQAQTS